MNCVVVEDDEAGRIHLKTLMEEIGGLTLLGEVADCASGFELIRNLPETELVLLDIELPDGTAFDLIEKLPNPPKIIFITNHEAYALRAFEVNALDYIQKPLTRTRLESALERLETGSVSDSSSEVRLAQDDLILLTENRRRYFTMVSDLLAVESDENYTHILRRDGKRFVMKKTLAAWEALLPPSLFRKAGRSLLVNLAEVDRIEPVKGGGQLWFKGRPDAIGLSKAAMRKLQTLARTV